MSVLVALLWAILPVTASAAAKISFSAPSLVTSGDQFLLAVMIDSGGDQMNALSGTISVSGGLSVKNILKSDGLVPLWIEAPAISSGGSEVTFAGIIPGGWSGKRELMSLVVLASSSGAQSVSAGDLEIRANDNAASLIPVSSRPLAIQVMSGTGTSTVSLEDALPPEPFLISIARDKTLWGGAPFAVFGTQDKQTGIDRYEAAFAYFGSPKASSWQKAQSPYEIPKSGLGKMLYVRAVDRAGNIRLSSVSTPGYYARLTVFGIISLLILWVLYAVLRKLLRSPSRSF